jgi:pilus assembly protein CpaF
MLRIWYHMRSAAERQLFESQGTRIYIGSDDRNDLVLKSPFVAPQHAVLDLTDGGWQLSVVSPVNSVAIEENELSNGDTCLLNECTDLVIYPFTLSVELSNSEGDSLQTIVRLRDNRMTEWIQNLHRDILPELKNESNQKVENITDQQLLHVENLVDSVANHYRDLPEDLLNHITGHAVRSQLINQQCDQDGQSRRQALLKQNRRWSRVVTANPDRERELENVANQILMRFNLPADKSLDEKLTVIDREFWTVWDSLAKNLHVEMKRYGCSVYVKKQLKDILYGFGPLEDLLWLPTISEIMVVDHTRIYIEREGRVEDSGRRFVSNKVTETIIARIVGQVGRSIDKSNPMVDARMADGSRVNAVIPPLAVSGPCLTIRKFPERKLTVDQLVAYGSLSETVARFLRAAVLARKNIVVAGGTGTGKTTLLNCLSDFIPNHERIVTIEDTAELQLHKQHVVRMETKPPNLEGKGEYTIRDLVKNALRMRPDRVVVGECRGAEALDMLQAMNTGHDGSLTTIHANSANDAILRLEVLVQMAASLPIQSIRRQIAAGVDLIVQLRRMRDKRRLVTEIVEVVDYDEASGNVTMRRLFDLATAGDARLELKPTGYLPTFLEDCLKQEPPLIDLDAFYRTTETKELIH